MTKIACDNLFSQRVWKAKLGLDCKELEKFVYSLVKQDGIGAKKSNHSGWQSKSLHPAEFNDQVYKELVDSILSIVNSCAEGSGVPALNISNLWFNINSKHCYNVPHVHPRSVFSGAFYIKTNGDDGDIEFTRDDHSNAYLPETCTQNFYTSHSYRYSPELNTLLVFGSWMTHWVHPNTTNSDRISVSFNTYVR